MKEYLSFLSASALFANIEPHDIQQVLTCIGAQAISCEKDHIIFHQDEPARCFGIVISGSVHVVRGDIYGSHTIVAAFGAGEIFGEMFACSGVSALPVNVVAASDSVILMLEHARVISGCSRRCSAHAQLIINLLQLIAQKNILLNQKLDVVMQRTTRDKLMLYLQQQAERMHSSHFSIPFDRQGLAAYLGVERSAMSTELNKLKKEGLIDFHKNEFKLNIS